MPISPCLRLIHPAIWARTLERDMTVLVTGASGYVGAALVPRLQAAGHAVRGTRCHHMRGQGR